MRVLVSLLSALALAVPGAAARAEWQALTGDANVSVAQKLLVTAPGPGWSKSSSRPSVRSELWTRDGPALNELTFFAGVADGESLYFPPAGAEQELPKFRSAMLPTDIVELFESSNRIVLQSSVFTIESIQPARFGRHDGVRFAYSYAANEEALIRKGEGVAAIVGGKLYLVNFIAPAIHYFDRDIGEVRQLVSTIELQPPKSPRGE